MRFYYDNHFNFLGFSYNMSIFGVFAGVAAVIGGILLFTVFLPLYPLWYWLAMKNWDKVAETKPSDYFIHGSVKPRVFDMTKWEWKMLLCVWIFIAACLPFIIRHNAEKERLQKEADKAFVIERDRKEREWKNRYQMWLDGKISADELYHIEDYGSAKSVKRQQPDKDLEYYDEHFDDYHDDPEDGITYPDEVFDFYDD